MDPDGNSLAIFFFFFFFFFLWGGKVALQGFWNQANLQLKV